MTQLEFHEKKKKYRSPTHENICYKISDSIYMYVNFFTVDNGRWKKKVFTRHRKGH